MDYSIISNGILILVVGSVIYYMYYRNKKNTSDFEPIAAKFNGYVKRANFILGPKIIIPFEGHNIAVYFVDGGRNSPPYTKFDFEFQHSGDLTFNIYKETMFTGAMKLVGFKEITINNPEFDKHYFIRAKDEFAIRNFLSTDIQNLMLLFKDYSSSFYLDKRGFYVSVKTQLTNRQDLEQFIESSIGILKKVRIM